MMDLGLWWACLTVSEKCRVASKACSKINQKEVTVGYPKCTEWWNGLDEAKKIFIYQHLTDKHGVVMNEWQDGYGYSE